MEDEEAGELAAGDSGERSLESLYALHAASLARALHAAGVPDAHDAVQEAFVQAVVHWRKVSRYDDPLAWIRRVAINRGHNHLRVAGPRSTVAPTDASTIAPSASTPQSYDSSSAPPPPTDTTAPGGSVGPTTTVTLPSAAPQVSDLTGTSALAGFYFGASGQQEVPVGASALIHMYIRNSSDHTIWAANSTLPTAIATVCSTESADPTRSLWWMTNIALAPGDNDARSGTFIPTAAYLGKVECELDIVAPTDGGTSFDTSAGGDPANGTIIAPVVGVPPITFLVHAPAGTAKGPISHPPSAVTATTVP